MPLKLALTRGFILVAGSSNKSIIMLSQSSACVKKAASGIDGAWNMWFDKQSSRLYVADTKRINVKPKPSMMEGDKKPRTEGQLKIFKYRLVKVAEKKEDEALKN